MGLLETIITLLIWLAVIVLVVVIVLWVLEALGIALPPRALQILWLILCLVALLIIVRMLGPVLHLPKLGALALSFFT